MPFVELEFSDLEFYESLGSGSSGSVYRALWRSEERVVAVKKLLILEKEAEVLSSLSHRNIIQFYGAVTVAPNYSIITEYAECGSLYEFLKKESIDFNQILLWAKEIALGMNYLHFESPVPVIHRDLKSKNVVISGDLTAKLCDFGSSNFHTHTTKLTLQGTFPWMAPEVIQGLPITTACDVYSYSVVLWELLTHEVPFKGLEGMQVAWLVVAKEERLTIPGSCPPMFAQLMTSCWTHDPSKRLHFRQVLEHLDKMLKSDSLEAETASFLGSKDKWKKEIDDKLEDLKVMEHSLTSKEAELNKRERNLAVREKQLSDTLTRSTVSSLLDHDVNLWDEEEVANWVYGLGGVNGAQRSEYSELFAMNHITGKTLFLLTDMDLLQLGVLSVGHRRELMDEIEGLRQDNHRLLHFPPLANTGLKSLPRPKPPEPTKETLTIIYSNLCRQRTEPGDHLWKYLVDFEGDHSGHSLVKEVHIVFSKSIPTDVLVLTQQPFVTECWREGPNPGHLEIVVYYKDKVLRPRETRYTFTPLEAGHTEELCVRIEIKQKSDTRRLSVPLSDSVASDAPITGEEVVTPVRVRTNSNPQLTGAWVARSHVIRPPLEPRTSTKTPDSSYPSSATNSVSSVASNDSDTVKAMSRLTQSKLQGVWSKTGTTGAQIVKRQQRGGKMFNIGGPDAGQRPPRTHMPSREVCRVGDDQALRHSISSPALTGGIEPRSRQFSNKRSHSQPYGPQVTSDPRPHTTQNYSRPQQNRRDSDQPPRQYQPNKRTYRNDKGSYEKKRLSGYDPVPEDEEVQFQRSVSDIGPKWGKSQEQPRGHVTRETVPPSRGRGRQRK
ncbi:mitogen-activated protein kinase kinase kinase 20-like [Halichondria panicea]|uniref:mitogen-activated protein kinase kinase kinase 20-like n=1 Tax=Halichondria panicea TaxID=6063 RepID=UPI00312B55DC